MTVNGCFPFSILKPSGLSGGPHISSLEGQSGRTQLARSISPSEDGCM